MKVKVIESYLSTVEKDIQEFVKDLEWTRVIEIKQILCGCLIITTIFYTEV